MKFIQLLFIFTISICWTSCSKTLDISDPELIVNAEKVTITEGEPVIFNFGTGSNADIVNFYSGEINSDYNYSYGISQGRYMFNNSGYTFSFGSRFDNNNPDPNFDSIYGNQKNQLAIFASTDFNGKLDATSITAANWVDVTSKFKLPTAAHASTFTASGTTELADLLTKGKPLYIAYKLTTLKQAVNGYTQFWNINNFVVRSKDSLGNNTVVLYNQNMLEFNFVDITADTRASRASSSSGLLRMGGPEAYLRHPSDDTPADSIAPGVKVLDPDKSEVWAISKPVNADSVFLGYDKPYAVVQYSTVEFPRTYGYLYKQPGTYEAVFVGTNTTKDETKNIVKKLIITVKPKE